MKRTSQKNKERFLAKFRETGGNVRAACGAAKIERFRYYRWLSNDDEFRAEISKRNDEISKMIIETITVSNG